LPLVGSFACSQPKGKGGVANAGCCMYEGSSFTGIGGAALGGGEDVAASCHGDAVEEVEGCKFCSAVAAGLVSAPPLEIREDPV